MKKVSKKSLWIFVLVLSILVCVACAVFLSKYIFDSQNTIERPTLSNDVTTAEESGMTEATQEPTQRFDETTVKLSKSDYVSFKELLEINPDIYAWIYIPNTSVDYPIAQSSPDKSDDFYLYHNVYGEYQFSGTIYSEKANSRDFSDPVTVLYGHNMLNGSMFSTLHNFSDEDFFKNNNSMFVFTKDKVLTYIIYSAYEYDDRHILNSFNFVEESQFKQYLDSTTSPRSYNCNVRDNIVPNTDDRILTLSTCTNGSSNTRYLVQGVLIDEQPTQ